MKKYLYNSLGTLCLMAAATIMSCSDENDFPNKPQSIDIQKAIVVTPLTGGLQVDWTPNPEDKNFEFLNIHFTDQDGKARNYNMSRYNSRLVVPEYTKPGGTTVIVNTKDEVTLFITGLVNQSYTLNFAAYNNDNNKIDLGSRSETPNDYTQGMPDSLYNVTIIGLKKKIALTWQEPPMGSGSTLKGIRFFFEDNFGQKIEKTYTKGIRHDTVEVAPGDYTVTYETFSEVGKKWVPATYNNNVVSVIEFNGVDKWSATDKAGWTIVANTEQVLPSENGYAKNILDGDLGTYWHNSWSADWLPAPYFLDITLDKAQLISGFLFSQRAKTPNRWVKEFAVYLKETEEETYPTTPNFTGQLADIDGKQTLMMRKAVTAKYIQLKLISSWMKDATSEKFYCIGEFGLVVADTAP